ncbi:MAG: hypothetical protein AAF409_07105 [Pseudomonadota bacterium]
MRFIGALLVLVSLGMLGAEGFWWLTGGSGAEFELASLGQWWSWVHESSLQLVAPAIERHLPGGPWLYETFVQPVLLWPGVIEVFVVGVVLIVLGKLL